MATTTATTNVESTIIADTSGHRSNAIFSMDAEETVDDAPEPANSSGQAEYPAGAKLWLILLALDAILILNAVDANIVATAVPMITDHFHTVTDVGWYSSAFRLCQCAFQFIFGKAYKLFSVKRVFLLANTISIAGSLLCGAAATSTMLVLGRALTGLGSAGLLSGVFVILVQSTPLHRRPSYLSVLIAVEGLAMLFVPLLGSALQSFGWRWCFYINPPIGVVTLLLTTFCFSDTLKPSNIARMTFMQKLYQIDIVSNLLFIPALSGLFLALTWAGTKYSWNSGAVIGLLITFAVLISAFIYNQSRRGDAAAIPPRIIKRRSVIAGFIFVACVNSTDLVFQYYLPTYYQIVRGYSLMKSGCLMLPIIFGGTIGAVIHGFGTSAIGYYAPFMLFASIIMPIAAGLITTFHFDTSLVQLILCTSFSGLAYGIGFSGPQNAVQTILPAEDVALGTSIMLFAQSFGPALSVPIAQVIFTNQLSANLNWVVPGQSGADIENLGLSEIVTSIDPAKITEVFIAIDRSITQTWYLVVGLACATMVGSLMIEWRSVKTRRD